MDSCGDGRPGSLLDQTRQPHPLYQEWRWAEAHHWCPGCTIACSDCLGASRILEWSSRCSICVGTGRFATVLGIHGRQVRLPAHHFHWVIRLHCLFDRFSVGSNIRGIFTQHNTTQCTTTHALLYVPVLRQRRGGGYCSPHSWRRVTTTQRGLVPQRGVVLFTSVLGGCVVCAKQCVEGVPFNVGVTTWVVPLKRRWSTHPKDSRG